MKSPIHDARFSAEDAVLRGKRLSIPLDRDCWELEPVLHPDRIEMYFAKARLTVSPVYDLEWRFDHGYTKDENGKILIHNIIVMGEKGNFATIIIDGYVWKLQMRAEEYDPRMTVRDLEVPYLYSERHEGNLE